MLCAVRTGLNAGQRGLITGLKLSRCAQSVSMSSCQTGLRNVPATLLGSNAFGRRADADLSGKMVQVFLERGHHELDTAFMYADGRSETIIGGMRLPKTGIAAPATL